jgi:hypothetical protein
MPDSVTLEPPGERTAIRQPWDKPCAFLQLAPARRLDYCTIASDASWRCACSIVTGLRGRSSASTSVVIPLRVAVVSASPAVILARLALFPAPANRPRALGSHQKRSCWRRPTPVSWRECNHSNGNSSTGSESRGAARWGRISTSWPDVRVAPAAPARELKFNCAMGPRSTGLHGSTELAEVRWQEERHQSRGSTNAPVPFSALSPVARFNKCACPLFHAFSRAAQQELRPPGLQQAVRLRSPSLPKAGGRRSCFLPSRWARILRGPGPEGGFPASPRRG